jgi:putative ABC transport system permease protein
MYLRTLIRRAETDKELDEELSFHMEKDASRLVASGANPEEARFAARRAFGNVGMVAELTRDASRLAWLERLGQDVPYALRALRKSPGFTAVAVLSLALGIGANAAIFSVVNATLFRSLPFENPDRLVGVWEWEMRSTRAGADRSDVAPANFLDWQRQSRSFTGLAAYATGNVALTGGGEPSEIRIASVSTSMFWLLGVQPVAGRTFLPDEADIAQDRVVILSSGLWQRRFGPDTRLAGQRVTLDGDSYTVVGVVASEQALPRDVEIWRPLRMGAPQSATRGAHFLQVVARLRPGVTPAQARSELGGIAARLERLYPITNTGDGISLVPLHDEAVGSVRRPLMVLFVAVGFVLLIACANVAALFLARAAARQHEMALRVALGAGRSRLVQQLLTEGVVLSLVGAAVGLCLAVWGTRLMVALSPVNITGPSGAVTLDGRVILFTIGLSIITGLGFALTPALRASAPNLRDSLQVGGRRSSSGSATARTRRFLVATELALTMVLLAGTALMVRSLQRLQRVDLGFAPTNVLTTEIHLPGSRYPGGTSRSATFYQQLLRELRATPGVQSAGAVFMLPLGGDNRFYSFRKYERPDEELRANFRVATPGYLTTIGVRLRHGRDFTNADSTERPGVVLINETMARRFWPGTDPVGKRITIRNDSTPREIIGVISDIRHFGADMLPEAEMYAPHGQYAMNGMTVVVRTSVEPLRMAATVEAQVHRLDKDLPLVRTQTMGHLVDRSFALRRFALRLLGAFAIAALLLSVIGIYGLVAYSVTQRRYEIGIRMALGAGRMNVLRLLTAETLRLATVGVVTGLVGALALGRALSTLVYQTGVTDVPTLVLSAATLVGVALIACAFPAMKATRINPVTTMRQS